MSVSLCFLDYLTKKLKIRAIVITQESVRRPKETLLVNSPTMENLYKNKISVGTNENSGGV